MDPFRPFRPQAPTGVIGVQTGTAPAATLLGSGLSGDVAYLVYNPSTVDAWLGYGMTSGAAQAASVIPIISGPQSALVSPAGSLQVFTLTGGLFWSGIAQLGSCSVYVTPGDGS